MSAHGWSDQTVLEARGIIRRLLRAAPLLEDVEHEAIVDWMEKHRPPEGTYSEVMRAFTDEAGR